MRISVHKDDPGYRPIDELRSYEIYLDGVQQRDVLTADEDEGFVLRYRRGRDEKLVVFDDLLQEERVEGVVLVETASIIVSSDTNTNRGNITVSVGTTVVPSKTLTSVWLGVEDMDEGEGV